MLSIPLSNLAQPNKASISNCVPQSSQQQQHAELMHIKQHNQVDEKGPTDLTATQKAPPPVCLVMEENLRMRRAIGDAVLTLTQWVHETKDQNGNVASLVDRMKKSVQKHNSHQPEDVLKAMAMQMEARESEWAAERLAFQEKERVSKQMIFNLQQDNYRLRKSRIYALIPRGPSA